MTVLVTGGGGFIGSHLVDHILANTSEEIRIFDDFSTGEPSNLAHIDSDRVVVERGDIRDAEAVTSAATGVDTIYHLAAAVGVQKVVDEPLDALKTNLKGTENVLEAALTEDAPVFIASSSEVYGKSESLPFSEDGDRVLGPVDVPRWGYASAKAVDEFLGLAYHDQHGLPVTVGRYFNIVGPRQVGEYGMVIPTFVEQALANEPLTVYGDGTQERSFTHVTDATRATHELLEADEADGEIFNIGAPEPTTINDLAERVIEHTDSDSEITHVPFAEAYGEDFEEPDQREPDITKLRETLGWAPETCLDQILEDVIEEKRQSALTEAN
jgi:UDP-glucose 4-epimerase